MRAGRSGPRQRTGRADGAQARAARIDASASQGLARLGQISTLLVFAAMLAMAAAMGASIWQRRASLARPADARASARAQLRRVLLLESDARARRRLPDREPWRGVYGQVVIDRYLRGVTGFPVARIAAGWRPFEIVALVVLAALAVVAIPGWFAARVPPQLGLQDR